MRSIYCARNNLTVAIFAITFFALALLPAWCMAAEAPANAKSPGVREVVIVFKTHFDIGYTDMASNVVRRYRTTMIDQALQVVEQNKNLRPEQQFAWTIPGWPMKKISEDWEGLTPERQQKIMQAFKDGRFVVHALPFTMHTETLEPEDLVRGLGFASALARKVGLPLPRDAKMTDVPCHSWIIPTLLRNAGVDFLHLGCNAASSSPKVPTLFFWEGPDGSRVLTMYSAAGYGTGLVPPADWPYQTWLALIHTGDNHGPPTPEEVKKLLAEAAQKLPGIKVRIGRLSDFADSIFAEKANIPVVRGDMPDTWIHGPMCDPSGAKIARNIRPAITTTELLNTQMRLWGLPVPDISRTIADAYEQSLLYGEHTWGGAQYWVTKYGSGTQWGYGGTWKADREKGRFQRLEDSWAEHTAYIEKAQQLVAPVLQSHLKTLAESVDQQGDRIVVFNPLPWRRIGGLAEVDVRGTSLAKQFTGVLRSLRDPDAWPNYVCDGKTLRFQSDVEPLGYTTLTFGHRDPESWYYPEIHPDSAEIRTGEFKAGVDPRRGTVRSLVREQLPKAISELFDFASPYGFGQVLYERFDSNNVAAYVKSYVKINADWAVDELGKPVMPSASLVPYRAASPTNFTVTYTSSWHTAEAIMKAPASKEVPFGVTTRLISYNWAPCFDLEITIHDKPADPWPEAAWICLPIKADAPQFRLGRQGSIIDPAKDIVPGANHNFYMIDSGLAVYDGATGRGLAMCPMDNPLVSLDEPGCWKYSPDFVPKKPVVFINLFNNQWTTNFRMWNHGTWTSRIRFWPYDQNWVRRAWEARYPLQAVCVSGPAGKLPVVNAGLSTWRLDGQQKRFRRDLLLTAFGKNPDGAGTLLRFWEMNGSSENCVVSLPDGLKAQSVQPVNLRGMPVGAPITVTSNSFTFPVRPFAPASFVIPAE